MSEPNEAVHFKNVVANLATDALAVLEEMRKDCGECPMLGEKFHLLHHYLTYLDKLFKGEA